MKKKIRKILNKALVDFIQAEMEYTYNKKGKVNGMDIKESKTQEMKRLVKNFHIYAKALTHIYKIVNLKNYNKYKINFNDEKPPRITKKNCDIVLWKEITK